MDRKTKKMRQGVVVSNKMDKTVVVLVERTTKHPLYKRIVRLTKKYKAHDEENQCQQGDLINIVECKRISKDKTWRLGKVIKKAV